LADAFPAAALRREQLDSEAWEKSLAMTRFRTPYYGRAIGSAPAAAALRR